MLQYLRLTLLSSLLAWIGGVAFAHGPTRVALPSTATRVVARVRPLRVPAHPPMTAGSAGARMMYSTSRSAVPPSRSTTTARYGSSLTVARPMAAPTITSFSPTSAVAGAVVTVNGTNLGNVTAFSINGITVPLSAITSSTTATATSFTFVMPAGVPATGTSTVSNVDGSGSRVGGFTALLRLVSTSPAVATTVAPVANSATTVTFTEPVTAASANTIKVFSSQVGGVKAGTRTVAGSAVNFASTLSGSRKDFIAGEPVSVSVPASVVTAAGLVLAPKVVQFNTATSGTGLGYFLAPSGTGSTPQLALGQNAWSVAPGDVDGDGDLDLVTANYGGNTVSIRLNDGSGGYSG
ncbi:IPT/TIG domain-containing protein, partial [Hymenobacter sp. ASUV-10]